MKSFSVKYNDGKRVGRLCFSDAGKKWKRARKNVKETNARTVARKFRWKLTEKVQRKSRRQLEPRKCRRQKKCYKEQERAKVLKSICPFEHISLRE